VSTFRLPVLSPAAASQRGVIVPPSKPALRGSGPNDWACGSCGAVLVTGAPIPVRLANAAIQCPDCSAVNDVDFAPGANPATV